MATQDKNLNEAVKVRKISKDEFKKTYFKSSEESAVFAKDVLVYGGYYGIIHDSGISVAIQDLPFEYCRSRFKNA
jgi:hypothetical protein